MDQSRHRSRACHGVREPYMQWELGRFPDRSEEEKNCSRREDALGDGSVLDGLRYHGDVEGFRSKEQYEDPEHESNITDASSDEGLDSRIGVLAFLPVMADQEVG